MKVDVLSGISLHKTTQHLVQFNNKKGKEIEFSSDAAFRDSR